MSATVLPASTLSPADARELRVFDARVHLIDVRTPGEFAGVHITDSHNIPLDQLSAHVEDIANTSCPVVLVCKSGARANQAHQQLTRAGRGELHVLSGGVDAWHATGESVVRGNTEVWALDRQVRLVAGGLVLAGMAASTVVPNAKWLSGAIGAGLTFSAVSNTCAMGTALSRLPYNRTSDVATDVGAVVASLRSTS